MKQQRVNNGLAEMSETARKIESLALMLMQSAEAGGLTQQMTEDAAEMIVDLAADIRDLAAAAQSAATDAA